MKLKGVHQLNASITRAVNKTARVIMPCFLSAEFAFYPEDEFINYTLIETERTQRNQVGIVARPINFLPIPSYMKSDIITLWIISPILCINIQEGQKK